MGWLRKRFGETNTAVGALMVYQAALAAFPAYAPLIHGVAAVAGVGAIGVAQS